MKILEKGLMPNEVSIQIEDWSKDYSFMSYGSTIAAYPKSKQTLEGSFSPNVNEKFRFQLEFNNYEEAQEAYYQLINGKSGLINYVKNFNYKGKKEILSCI